MSKILKFGEIISPSLSIPIDIISDIFLNLMDNGYKILISTPFVKLRDYLNKEDNSIMVRLKSLSLDISNINYTLSATSGNRLVIFKIRIKKNSL